MSSTKRLFALAEKAQPGVTPHIERAIELICPLWAGDFRFKNRSEVKIADFRPVLESFHPVTRLKVITASRVPDRDSVLQTRQEFAQSFVGSHLSFLYTSLVDMESSIEIEGFRLVEFVSCVSDVSKEWDNAFSHYPNAELLYGGLEELSNPTFDSLLDIMFCNLVQLRVAGRDEDAMNLEKLMELCRVALPIGYTQEGTWVLFAH